VVPLDVHSLGVVDGILGVIVIIFLSSSSSYYLSLSLSRLEKLREKEALSEQSVVTTSPRRRRLWQKREIPL
jgi:hypothetical protein